MNKFVKTMAGALIACSLLVGCSSVSLDESAKQGTLLGDRLNGQTTAQDQSNANAINPFEDPNNPLSQMVIYFPFDQYDVDAKYMPIIEAHAKWLMAHPEDKLILQGHTDERGGREYNLALGQKRSEAVRQRLLLLGVPAAQIEAVSFGEEKPEAYGHDEEAWSQNRRVQFYYPKH